MSIFLGDPAAAIVATACREEPAHRHPSVAALAADFAGRFGRTDPPMG